MDLTQIRYFLALAKTLNFTRAAEACNVTQPALTKSIQRLEEELGGPLLLRERSHTQLTPLGTTVLPLLQQTFDAAQSARARAAEFGRTPAARLRLGIGEDVEPSVIAPLLQPVMRRFPALELTTAHGDAAALNAALLASDVDIVLTADAQRLTERANRWVLFADPVVVAMAASHPWAAKRHPPISQLPRSRACWAFRRPGFHAWRQPPLSAHALADLVLPKQVRTIHASSRETYTSIACLRLCWLMATGMAASGSRD